MAATALTELFWAPYHEFGIPDPSLETWEVPPFPIRVRATGYFPQRAADGQAGEKITVYWERHDG